jgi:hypothetical protein
LRDNLKIFGNLEKKLPAFAGAVEPFGLDGGDATVATRPTDATAPWTQATFEAAEEAMLAEGAKLSLEEKLLWIQEINRFAALLKPMAAAPEPAKQR